MDAHQQKGWQQFLHICQHVETTEKLEEVFNVLFTFDERVQLASRVCLLKALLAGKKTQREIAKGLNISIAKITRGSNELKQLSESSLNDLKRLFLLD